MKKIIVAALLLASIGFSTISCSDKQIQAQSTVRPFEHLARSSSGQASGIDRIDFYRDTQTNIIYICVRDYNADQSLGGFTPYLNSEGNPMTYDEWKELYNVD